MVYSDIRRGFLKRGRQVIENVDFQCFQTLHLWNLIKPTL